jgi:hypothetical protein
MIKITGFFIFCFRVYFFVLLTAEFKLNFLFSIFLPALSSVYLIGKGVATTELISLLVVYIVTLILNDLYEEYVMRKDESDD